MHIKSHLTAAHQGHAAITNVIFDTIFAARVAAEITSGISMDMVTELTAGEIWSRHSFLPRHYKWGEAWDYNQYLSQSPHTVEYVDVISPWSPDGFTGTLRVSYLIPVIKDINHVYGQPYISYDARDFYIPDSVYDAILNEMGVILDIETFKNSSLNGLDETTAFTEWVKRDIEYIAKHLKG